MIANIATDKPFKHRSMLVKKQSNTIKFSKKTLEQLKRSVINKPIKLISGGYTVGRVFNAWVENDNTVFIMFEGETFNKNYIVPALSVSSSQDGILKTVRCLELILTNNPSDKKLLTLNTTNLNFVYENGGICFIDETHNISKPYETFTEANKEFLKYIKLL